MTCWTHYPHRIYNVIYLVSIEVYLYNYEFLSCSHEMESRYRIINVTGIYIVYSWISAQKLLK